MTTLAFDPNEPVAPTEADGGVGAGVGATACAPTHEGEGHDAVARH